MPLKIAPYASGVVTIPQAFTKGAVVEHTAYFDFPAGYTHQAADIIELTGLPSYSKILAATIVPVGNFGTATADVGIMTGKFNDPSGTRTVGNEIFEGAALTDLLRNTKKQALLVAPTEAIRGIGVKLSANVVGAGQRLAIQFLMAE